MKNKPVSAQTDGDHTTVLVNVSGNFPGSPIRLHFHFSVAAGLISRLEITP